MRSASGANFLLKTRSRSSWPRRIRTAALASTVPDRARMNSWYCSTFPHSTKRAFTAARKVEADTSSCSVGKPGTASSTSSTSGTSADTLLPVLARARFAGGAATAPSKTSASCASCSLWIFILALNLSARDAGTAAGAAPPGAVCQAPARETCLAAPAAVDWAGSALTLAAPAAGRLPLVANRDGCEVTVGSSASGSSCASARRSASIASSSRVQVPSGSSVHQFSLSS
mmetsp:Transcript_17100/g.46353  ORF Transcript_17100/g.46353 Transcript_17100/m.46353 type:complete len:230 (-) Transcript_17100:1382-2071(-)